jgi:hypothetical protein
MNHINRVRFGSALGLCRTDTAMSQFVWPTVGWGDMWQITDQMGAVGDVVGWTMIKVKWAAMMLLQDDLTAGKLTKDFASGVIDGGAWQSRVGKGNSVCNS